MNRWINLAAVSLVILVPACVLAQPSRQIPGTRPYLPGSPPINGSDPNSRVRPAANQVGLESTDFYGKKGYPRVLGDSVETTTTGGSAAAGVGGNNGGGNTGVQSSGSGGFQGNSGNQIGNQGGGTVLGGLFGVANNAGGNALGGQSSVTGGAFTGMVPKGFGFGGTPDFTRTWTTPLSGISGK
jgi:hypothetical protein